MTEFFHTSWGKDESGEKPTLRAMDHFNCQKQDLGCLVDLQTGVCKYWRLTSPPNCR